MHAEQQRSLLIGLLVLLAVSVSVDCVLEGMSDSCN